MQGSLAATILQLLAVSEAKLVVLDEADLILSRFESHAILIGVHIISI